MLKKLMYVSVGVLVNALSIPAMAQSFQLSCDGIATSEEPDVQNAYVRDNKGNTVSGTIYGTNKSSLMENLQIIIDGKSGKIRLPQSLKPTLRGGQNGWYDLKNISVADDSITASAKVNLISSTRVFVNRFDGTVSLKTGAGTFFGKCSAYNLQDRKF